jgi:hypothetical protein
VNNELDRTWTGEIVAARWRLNLQTCLDWLREARENLDRDKRYPSRDSNGTRPDKKSQKLCLEPPASYISWAVRKGYDQVPWYCCLKWDYCTSPWWVSCRSGIGLSPLVLRPQMEKLYQYLMSWLQEWDRTESLGTAASIGTIVPAPDELVVGLRWDWIPWYCGVKWDYCTSPRWVSCRSGVRLISLVLRPQLGLLYQSLMS